MEKKKIVSLNAIIRYIFFVTIIFSSIFLYSRTAMAETHPTDLTGTAFGINNSCMWGIDSDNTFWIWPTDGIEGTLPSCQGYGNWPWYSRRNDVKKVVIENGVKGNTYCYGMFYRMENCTEMDLSNFNTGSVKYMNYMFSGCSGLTSLDVSGWDTGAVTAMNSIFSGCSGLINLDVSGWNTGNVTDMEHMFQYCKGLTSLDVSGWNTGSVTNMQEMFRGCSGLTSLDVSGWDTGAVTNMYFMFRDCSGLTSLDVSGWDTGSVTDMNSMFLNCPRLTSLDLSGWNTSSVTSMSSMFQSCSGLSNLDVSGWDTSSVNNLGFMFSVCSGLTSLDVSGWDTGAVTTMNSIFSGCSGLTNLDLSGWNTSSVTTMGYMFSGCSGLTTLDVSGWNTGKVTNMKYMFDNCKGLTSLDLSGWDTGSVTDMSSMFRNCPRLTSLDLSGWNTSSVTSMSSMFHGCSGLSNLDVSGWNTGNVIEMNNTFYGCSGLTSLDVSGWNTGAVTTMKSIFSGCSGLTTLDVSGWDTGAVITMQSMFNVCSSLQEVVLGQNFSFRGKNLAVTSSKAAILPTPPSATTTGKWIREDGSIEAKTPQELRADYGANAATWAGKWIWDVKSNTAIVSFDANGGYTSTSSITQQDTFEPIEMPNASRIGYKLTGWNTKEDGTREAYQVGGSFTPEAGTYTTFYAQWAIQGKYEVNYYLQNISLDGYTLIESNTFYADPDTVQTGEVKIFEGFIAPEQQSVTVSLSSTGIIDYYYDRTQFTITFDGNGADSGSMEPQTFVGGVVQRLNENGFKKNGNMFLGWNTAQNGSGTLYSDTQPVKDLAGNGENKTFYAQWIDLAANTVEATNGSYIVQIKAGQNVTIANLPAGIKYTIREISVPDGWRQTEEENSSGSIQSNEISRGSIKNEYSAKGYATFMAYKFMPDGIAEPGKYSFTLYKDGEPISTAYNASPDTREHILLSDGETIGDNPYYGMSVVQFDDIEFTEAGDFTFTIMENEGSDNSIKYDNHEETVVVHVSDNHNGTLTCVTEYDIDGPVFTNKRIPVFTTGTFNQPGGLGISKVLSGYETDAGFDFDVVITDPNGTELQDEYTAYLIDSVSRNDAVVYKTGSAVSYTENLDEYGTQLSNYQQGWSNGNIRGTGRETASSEAHVVTIPGAESLHVTVVYGGSAMDGLCLWTGAYPEYTVSANRDSAVDVFFGGEHTNTDNTREYDISGDSVTFSYDSTTYHTSAAGDVGDGYGYYAIVTSNTPVLGVDESKVRETVSVHSGSTVTVKSGDTLLIMGLPESAQYSVTEHEKTGYELLTSTGDTGVIPRNEIVDASFTNSYSASGSAKIQMTKVTTGAPLTEGMFLFRLYDSSGNMLQEKTNNADGTIVFDPVFFTEEDAGKKIGFIVSEVDEGDPMVEYDHDSENVVVSVDDNGDGTLSTTVSYRGDAIFRNNIIVEKDVTFSKKGIGNALIAGAHLRVTGMADGEAADITPIEWISAENETKTLSLKPGSYTLTEIEAPAGYIKADSISFTLERDGTVKVNGTAVPSVDMTDDWTKVNIIKTDAYGTALAGAKLELLKSDGTTSIRKWTSTTSPETFTALPAGTYILREEEAPNGYQWHGEKTITISDTSTVLVITFENDKIIAPPTDASTNILPHIIIAVFSGNVLVFFYIKSRKLTESHINC